MSHPRILETGELVWFDPNADRLRLIVGVWEPGIGYLAFLLAG